jgi:F-box/leucine-rich repeat protein 2/20
MLEFVELTFTFCSSSYPSEIGFTQEGMVTLVQSCPIRVLMLNGANSLNDEGMKGLSSAQFLETLELVDCERITDAGMSFITSTPSLSSLTLRQCNKVTDNGMAELARSQKLESLTVVGCRRISQKAVQGAAGLVHYSKESESFANLKGMKKMETSTLFR